MAKIKRIKNSICEVVNGFERILEMSVPYDKRHKDPEKNCGIHGMDMRFVLRKGDKAVQFVVFTPIYTKNIQREFESSPQASAMIRTLAADVGYHAPTPRYEGQEPMKDCPYIGKPCYYDGSGLRAEEWEKVWLEEGSDAIWKLLEEEWNDLFKENE